MVQFKKADITLVPTIMELAQVIFPATYAPILSGEQIDYMMEWMYSKESLEKQLEEGHVYHIAYYDGEPVGYSSVQMVEDGVWQCDGEKWTLLRNFKDTEEAYSLLLSSISFLPI